MSHWHLAIVFLLSENICFYVKELEFNSIYILYLTLKGFLHQGHYFKKNLPFFQCFLNFIKQI
jgi:hypothetical protein